MRALWDSLRLLSGAIPSRILHADIACIASKPAASRRHKQSIYSSKPYTSRSGGDCAVGAEHARQTATRQLAS